MFEGMTYNRSNGLTYNISRLCYRSNVLGVVVRTCVLTCYTASNIIHIFDTKVIIMRMATCYITPLYITPLTFYTLFLFTLSLFFIRHQC